MYWKCKANWKSVFTKCLGLSRLRYKHAQPTYCRRSNTRIASIHSTRRRYKHSCSPTYSNGNGCSRWFHLSRRSSVKLYIFFSLPLPILCISSRNVRFTLNRRWWNNVHVTSKLILTKRRNFTVLENILVKQLNFYFFHLILFLFSST